MYTLGYWKIRGLRTPITFVLEYANIPYEEKFYEMTKDAEGNWSRDQWLSVKPNMPLDFPNLPYLEDHSEEAQGLKITQTNAIISYICNKHKVLLPDEGNLIQQAKMDMMVGVIGDFRMAFVIMSYKTGDTDGYAKNILPDWLEKMEKYFEKNEFCAGEKMTHADFNLYELLDHHRLVFDNILKDFPKLEGFMAKIDQLEEVKKYRASDKWFDHPMNNLCAFVK